MKLSNFCANRGRLPPQPTKCSIRRDRESIKKASDIEVEAFLHNHSVKSRQRQQVTSAG
jgi:hypothetical protein